jgi:hypothetical protein
MSTNGNTPPLGIELAIAALMSGAALFGAGVMGLLAQAGANEREDRYLAMLHAAWWETDCQVAPGVKFAEWVAELRRKVETDRAVVKERRAS